VLRTAIQQQQVGEAFPHSIMSLRGVASKEG
jgi:hypothetical protein